MKEPHKIGYKVLLTILKPIYKLYYRPTIINKEAIPNEGPVIICSNHIHLFDQNTALISTNRMIHYMAKKEHLDGKFGWFFKTVGCIRVDREIHDENAKGEAIRLLNNGYVIGLFPEGTRNQISGKKDLNLKLYKFYKDTLSYKKFLKILKEKRITKEEYINNALNPKEYIKKLYIDKKISKEEYYSSIILPNKFGAVSLASKTGALIVPYAVTGKYKFSNNNLTLKFGNPFKVIDSDNLEKYRQKLENEIIKLVLSK